MRKLLILSIIILLPLSVVYGAWKFNPFTSKQDYHDMRPSAPLQPTESCAGGETAFDGGYVYVCTNTNTWQRAQLATWVTTHNPLELIGVQLQLFGEDLQL